MTNLIIDASSDKIFLKIIASSKSYTNNYPNSKNNFEKLKLFIKKHKKDLEIGICGEHGGDPNSIKFCHSANISYVSASPHRIPIALVAAAQAAINQKSVTSK